MASIEYSLGSAKYLEQLFPPAKYANANLNFKNFEDVIVHYTKNSLAADGIAASKVEVELKEGIYKINIEGEAENEVLQKFSERHILVFSEGYAQKAIRGMELLKEMGVWNPMEGYHVNRNPADAESKWNLFPPLGLNIIGQKGMLLMHYPPWAVLQAGTFENAMTMQRWGRILNHAGVEEKDLGKYKTFIDINPIAAPGSGESEYPNDYFPIMMASGFFDGPADRDYIRSMLELFLNPPDLPEDSKYTLPLLICGSPLYDPQAPGWFKVAYKDMLPLDENGIPLVSVLQVGKFKIKPDSKRETPYLIGNHMIAAGVTGLCTNDPSQIPDMRQYEAQDLVAATFLQLYANNPNLDPYAAKEQACMRWYGNKYGEGAPQPPNENDAQTICALAQMDLFFDPTPSPHPKYTFEEAIKRCKEAIQKNNPCAENIKPANR
ncbi:hypothetical protein [Gillisia limnaea]|uniref:Uncharacterized protein n=1 Tax=Gillisia limnaea (strain DSM 15749 / LMG 21470 / R-8282) TaxID=865937 RepID=H2BSY5_GILLR|nr:hypothetical protein [Gillisia limnaea]EHQ01515.1 hypothetical protein Gilli_0818 [Gillisia limnaea DSM 15749]